MLSDSDLNLLATAQALEMAARDIYASLVSRKFKSDDEQVLLELIHSHHVAYEQSLNGLLGKRAATSRNSEVFTKFFASLSDSKRTWETLLELENTAVATHIAIVEKLSSPKSAALIASVINVEARHAAILATQISSNLSLALDNPTQSLVSQ